VRFVPAFFLLYFSNLYCDRTLILPALLLRLVLAIFFVPLSPRSDFGSVPGIVNGSGEGYATRRL